jgi:hypothetical protein
MSWMGHVACRGMVQVDLSEVLLKTCQLVGPERHRPLVSSLIACAWSQGTVDMRVGQWMMKYRPRSQQILVMVPVDTRHSQELRKLLSFVLENPTWK